jgi:hypothetical protein
MAFDKTPVLTVGSRTSYEIDNDADKELIKMFEREITPYLSMKKEYAGKVLSKIEVYMVEKGLMKYNEKYPYGCGVGNRVPEFNEVQMKWQALQILWDRRDYAKKMGQAEMDFLPA